MTPVSRSKRPHDVKSLLSVPTISKALFFLLAGMVLFLALTTRPEPGVGTDKYNHLAAFYTLTLVGVFSWSNAKGLSIAVVGLLLFGGLIEQLQFYVGRDREFLDWVADFVGVMAALIPVLVYRLRLKLRQIAASAG